MDEIDENNLPPVTLGPDFFAKADKAQAEVQASIRAALEAELVTATAQAPNGGAYVADGPAPIMDGTLLPPPGFVGRIAQFIYQQAPRPVAEVAIVGALGLMAGIAGRQWHIPGSGLNLYVVLVARSAIGKEAMHSGISTIIRAAMCQYPEAAHYVDFSDYASGQAILKASSQNPCFVNVAGEIGHKFVAMAENRDANMRTKQRVLLTLYDKSGPTAVAGGLAYSNQENNVEQMQSVSFSLIGETTPGTFYDSLTDAMMRNGFMSRFCVIEYTGDRPAKNVARMAHPPQALIDHIVPIIRQAGLTAAMDKFQEVVFSASAKVLLDRFEDECDVAIRASGDDESRRQLWNRAVLKALRVSALLAVGDNYLNPSVTEEHAAWAITLMRHGIATFLKRLDAGEVGEGTDGGREQKVLKLCGEFLTLPAGSKALTDYKYATAMQQAGIVPRNYLQRRTQRLSAFENHKLGHVAALNMTIKTATANGNLFEVKKEALVEQYGFFGQGYRVLSLK